MLSISAARKRVVAAVLLLLVVLLVMVMVCVWGVGGWGVGLTVADVDAQRHGAVHEPRSIHVRWDPCNPAGIGVKTQEQEQEQEQEQ